MIRLHNLQKYYNRGKLNEIHVIDNTSLTFPEIGLVALTGPSGCGKTTLLNVIGGLDKVDSGKISFDNVELVGYHPAEWDIVRNQYVGYIFQNYNLVPDKTVYENIEIALNMAGLYDKHKIEERIIKPTITGLISDGLKYNGFIFFGLIKVKEEPIVIEYNVRMGDPEAESVIPRIKSDLLELFIGIANENLEEKTFEIEEKHAAAIMQVAAGYPESYPKGDKISGLDTITDSIVFHAGTKFDENNSVLTNGGRVLAITSFGNSMEEALALSYKNAEKIKFKGSYYRKDLGKDLLKFIKK